MHAVYSSKNCTLRLRKHHCTEISKAIGFTIAFTSVVYPRLSSSHTLFNLESSIDMFAVWFLQSVFCVP